MVKSNKVVPASFKGETSTLGEVMDAVEAGGSPLNITRGRRRAAVVMRPEDYDRMARDAEEMELRRSLDESFEQMRQGRTYPLREGIESIRAELRSKYGRKRATSSARSKAKAR